VAGLNERRAPRFLQREHARLVQRTAVFVVIAASLPGCSRWLPRARETARHAPRIGAADFEYQRALHARYDAAWQVTAFLRSPGAATGPIYVFGDPIVARLADRPTVSSVHGWAWEVQPPSSWRRVERDLREARPAYIFVGRGEEAHLEVRGKGVRALLSESYEARASSSLGTWYELISEPSSSAT
jgi:hypothetical protein